MKRHAIEPIREERSEIAPTLRERLAPVLDDLSQTCQDRVVTEFEAEDLLDRLRDEFVVRVLAEMELWGEDEDLRDPWSTSLPGTS